MEQCSAESAFGRCTNATLFRVTSTFREVTNTDEVCAAHFDNAILEHTGHGEQAVVEQIRWED